MKILLAAMSIEPESRLEHSPNCAYSLGLAYIYSVLEKDGHEVKLLFLNNFDYRECEKIFFSTLKEWQPQIVGFQIFSMNRVSTFNVIEKMKYTHPGTRIIIGGIHVSVMYEQIIRKYPHIIAVIGEGEYTITGLLKAFESKAPLNSIKGICFCKDGKIIHTEPRELIYDLDALPIPKHEVFFDNEPKRTVGHIIASRGCPFNCSFCCLKVISKQKLRQRNIAKVVEEIKYLKGKYPRLKHIQFHDDTFLIDNERVIQFCKMVIEEKLSLTFECSARVKPISREMFWWMEKAGFKKIMFGLETGSEDLLKSIHKNITQKDVIELFNALRHFKFVVTTFLMCGFPGENEETISQTIDLVRRTQKIHYNWIAGVGKLWVYPGTEVYEKMKNAGHINDDFWLSDKPVPYYTVEHSFKKLVEFEERIMNSVSIGRIFTLKGFKNHFMKVPRPILGYAIKHPRHLAGIIKGTIKGYFSKILQISRHKN
jgi:radical SAM superfamily enzyme YgiQ (UPF0313 family)